MSDPEWVETAAFWTEFDFMRNSKRWRWRAFVCPTLERTSELLHLSKRGLGLTPPTLPPHWCDREKALFKGFSSPSILPGLREVTQLGRGLDQTWQQAADNIAVSLLPWVSWEIWYLVRVYTALYNREQGLQPDSQPGTKAGRLQSFHIGHVSPRLLGQGSCGQGKKTGAP